MAAASYNDPDDNRRGLQIESSLSVRQTAALRDLVATSVKESIDCVRESEDVFINLDDSLTTRVSDAWSTANYVGGSEECDGYMVRFNFSNSNPMTDVELLAELSWSVGCSSGARVYLDVYEQAADANWERVGGGWREPFSLNGSCLYNIDAYYEQAKVDIPAGVTRFRVAARAYGAARQHLPVKVIVTRP